MTEQGAQPHAAHADACYFCDVAYEGSSPQPTWMSLLDDAEEVPEPDWPRAL